MRLLQLLLRGANILQDIFADRWYSYSKEPWVNGVENGTKLAALCTEEPKIPNVLKNGELNRWDISFSNIAIRAVSNAIEKTGEKTDIQKDKKIRQLVKIRNEIQHDCEFFNFIL